LTVDVAVILPALNEIECVKQTVEGFLREGTRVVLVDNGSTDGTGEAAEKLGAEVVYESKRGYGNACLAGLSHVTSQPPSIVVFADCDGTQDSEEIEKLTAPVEAGEGFGAGKACASREGRVSNSSEDWKRAC